MSAVVGRCPWDLDNKADTSGSANTIGQDGNSASARLVGQPSAVGMLRVIAICPFDSAPVSLITALARSGALAVFKLPQAVDACSSLLEQCARIRTGPLGLMVADHERAAALCEQALPPAVCGFVLAASACESIHKRAIEQLAASGRWVIVQVLSLGQARDAVAAGAYGLIAKGSDSGGAVGESSAFILGQQLLGASDLDVPVWLQGGMGLHGAAAAVAGGAAGVVLEGQLALCDESEIGPDLKQIIEAMDGSETRIIDGQRVHARSAVARPARGSSRVLPAVGQDAALAGSLAKRFHSAGSLVKAILYASEEYSAMAAAQPFFAPGSPLAESFGTRYPIVQGPMTRVSDTPAFLEAVANAGALPCLGLGMARAEDAEQLLGETAAKLGSLPWGVGLLGFLEKSHFEAQLRALEEVRPRFAIVAGGQPEQAVRLAAQGTTAFLHVPSAQLLRLFLEQGARRFVFEGQEAGGHVGPRSSFLLWEQQLEVLLAWDRPEELEVLFAGGIHDGRSASMVAAAAAPLAEGGARLGLVMGTAYLCTREAVTTGALTEVFQQTVLGCERTALLETAPGHLTRCACTDYVQLFAQERERLRARGDPPHEVWATLEQLNLGRLRLAAKGVVRQGASERSVEEAEQRSQGLFMTGQVATLRRRVTSMEALHRAVCAGRGKAPRVPRRPRREAPADIAIVGMACILPDAADLDEFWLHTVRGHTAIREIDPGRWNPEFYYDPGAMGASAGRQTPSKWGGFLPDVAFDPLAYGIPPRSLGAIDPAQLLSLEVARRALEDAGYLERPFDRERTAVLFAAEAGTALSAAYGFRALYPQLCGEIPAELDAALPELSEDSFAGVLANVVAGRIANRLDLGGINCTVDAACASSLAALDQSVKELRSRGSDMVLCGAVDLHNTINDYLMFAATHALSARGECRAFDAEADGTVLGEGVACLVLKRLEDARRDGDRVYAVVKAVAGASDGRSRGLTAPHLQGQIRALERAYERAGIPPREVGLVEAHGTGTVVGDRTELAALGAVFSSAGSARQSCALGSVKSQIGHTKCAAGLAGVIRAALSAYHGVLPPASNLSKPNPGHDAESSPFYFNTRARPWPAPSRIAAVSALGFGGSNFHAVLAAEGTTTPATTSLRVWPAELMFVRGETETQAHDTLARLATWAAQPEVALRDIAHTLSSESGPLRFALVARSCAELGAQIQALHNGSPAPAGVYQARPGGPVPTLAWLFSGQGSQRPDMLAELMVAFPRLQRLLALHAPLAARIYPGTAWDDAAQRRQRQALADTRVAQPALGVVELALADILAWCGVKPQMLAGHSYGELVALSVAGACSGDELMALSQDRAEAILGAAGADPGAMAAVMGSQAEAESLLADLPELQQPPLGPVVVANANAPRQTVIAGPTAGIERAVKTLSGVGLACQHLEVACAFHSPVVAGARQTFYRTLEQQCFADTEPLACPVWSNTTARLYPEDAAAIRDQLARQLAEPVRFREQVSAMHQAGARVFLEVGPGRVLTDLVKAILDGEEHQAIALQPSAGAGLTELLHALAQLAALGVSVRTEWMFTDRGAERLDLRASPPSPSSALWWVNGFSAQPTSGPAPCKLLMPRATPVVAAPVALAPTRTETVAEYLRGVRELVKAQRDVMLGYLGASPAPQASALPEVSQEAGRGSSATPDSQPEGLSAVERQHGPRPLEEELLALMSERTGYPREMLTLDLNLEADLSIDSIKRIEILGELRRRLGLDAAANSEPFSELGRARTLREILDTLAAHGAGANPAAVGQAAPETQIPLSPGSLPVGRYLLRQRPAPMPAAWAAGSASERADAWRGQRVTIGVGGPSETGVDATLVRCLSRRLAGSGAQVQVATAGTAIGKTDLFIEVATGQATTADSLVQQLVRLQQAVAAGATHLVVLTGRGGRMGRDGVGGGEAMLGGGAGMIKSVLRERDGLRGCAIDLDVSGDLEERSQTLVEQVVVELARLASDSDPDAPVEIGLCEQGRATLELVASPLPRTTTKPYAGLFAPDAVVLLTGGARGIAGHLSQRLARLYRCNLELVGRTCEPTSEDLERMAQGGEPAAWRKALIAGGMREPARIEAECARLGRVAEVDATLKAIRAAGAKVRYHGLDVTDQEAFGALLASLYEQHGRIDAVFHAAGVLEDAWLADKSEAAFARVVQTKLNPALTLASALRPEVRFAVFFASVAGVFGNRGQLDYAAANEALDTLAWRLQSEIEGRALSVDWGPWRGAGMVTPELERHYQKQGVALIGLEEGIHALLSELACGVREEAQVVLASGDVAALGAREGPSSLLADPPGESVEEVPKDVVLAHADIQEAASELDIPDPRCRKNGEEGCLSTPPGEGRAELDSSALARGAA